MKKIFILYLLICGFPILANAQIIDTTEIKSILINQTDLQNRMLESGHQLTKYRNLTYLGMEIQALGAFFTAAGLIDRSNPQNNNPNYEVTNQSYSPDTLIYGGIGLSIVGFLLDIAAINHIGKAGLILKGNSVAITLP